MTQLPNTPSILFLIPGAMQRQTGGSLYNRKLAESLTAVGFLLDIVSVPDLPYFLALVEGVFIAPLLLFQLSRRKYDIVIEDGWAQPTLLLFNVICGLIGRTRPVIIVHQVRSAALNRPLKFIARIIERFTLRSARLIVTVSAFISGEVERLTGGHPYSIVASPGSDPPPGSRCVLQEGGDQPLRLLFVGNCGRLKGLDHLVEALSLLKDLDLRLDIVGNVSLEPRYYKSLVRKADALGLGAKIAFHGAIPPENLGAFYSRAHIFTFPSLYEGFGIALGEAMHAGLPIVATRTGPVNEILREGENALIVPTADSEALAGAIRKLASDSAMRESFGRRSLELAASLPTWKQTCDSIRHHLSLMIRTTPDKKQKRKTIPTR